MRVCMYTHINAAGPFKDGPSAPMRVLLLKIRGIVPGLFILTETKAIQSRGRNKGQGAFGVAVCVVFGGGEGTGQAYVHKCL